MIFFFLIHVFKQADSIISLASICIVNNINDNDENWKIWILSLLAVCRIGPVVKIWLKFKVLPCKQDFGIYFSSKQCYVAELVPF